MSKTKPLPEKEKSKFKKWSSEEIEKENERMKKVVEGMNRMIQAGELPEYPPLSKK